MATVAQARLENRASTYQQLAQPDPVAPDGKAEPPPVAMQNTARTIPISSITTTQADKSAPLLRSPNGPPETKVGASDLTEGNEKTIDVKARRREAHQRSSFRDAESNILQAVFGVKARRRKAHQRSNFGSPLH